MHRDILGRDIKEGDVVAVGKHNSLHVCKIVKVTPKMVRVETIIGKRDWLSYGSDVVKIEGEDALAYVLKGGK